MRAVFDTNVVLDLLLDRYPWSEEAAELFARVETGELEGYLCATTVTTIHYLATRTVGRNQARREVRKLLSLFDVAPVQRPVLDAAIELDFDDFEDAVLYEASRQVSAGVIVTRDVRGFGSARLPVLSPKAFASILSQREREIEDHQISSSDQETRMTLVHGIHHVTAISGDAQENLDSYTQVMGLRLVKRSVNQDAPDTYHLFYADGEGRPGTDLTFFPWPRMRPAVKGTGLAVEVGFAVPAGSLAFWAERLAAAEVDVDRPIRRFGEDVITFRDPHGLELSLTESRQTLDTASWNDSPVPEQHQIRGFHAVRLWERDLAVTSRFLTEVMGYEAVGEEDGWHRFAVEGGGSSRLLELRERPDAPRGSWGTGGVHHVAFRVADDDEEGAMRERVAAAGAQPTPVIDRFWFKSVYFREPGGVLFELATDGPGFTADEDLEHLGDRLILPPWLEPRRREIEASLPPLR